MSGAHAWPRWIDELSRSLPTCAQFVVYGNIRDDQLTPVDGELLRTSLITCIEERFRARGYARLLAFNTAGGLRVLPEEAGQSLADDLLRSNSRLSAGLLRRALAGEGGPEIVRILPELSRAVHASMVATALVVENASRLVRVPGQLDETELQLFAACEQVMHEAEPRYADQALFNPTIWLTDGVRDLPDWMVVAGERSRAIAVPLPDEDARQICADALAVAIEPAADDQGLRAGARQFAALCQGLTLREMVAVTQIAGDQGTGLREIGDALRSYKVGDPQDPWRGQGLRDRLRDAPETIRGQVKGQEVAINQALDILVRAALGLSGAQAASSGGRPRGVLFFAGPTGVGKTELAKAISRVVFGAQDAFVRFDMSEFSAEHADARLIGAPPGYVGYDAGGELVNAVRQQPFRVLLFDEIEKANPRILDKFLQVLEDGRLTDGRGDTVHFSESIIIFTSNLGVSTRDEHGRVRMNITQSNSYDEIYRILDESIRDYFSRDLQRPELYNRIGKDNVIIFDFIRPSVANEIFEKNLANIIERVESATGVRVELTDEARETVRRHATGEREGAADDEGLLLGARGIGSALETCLINPLARALFALREMPSSVTIERVVQVGSAWEVQLRC